MAPKSSSTGKLSTRGAVKVRLVGKGPAIAAANSELRAGGPTSLRGCLVVGRKVDTSSNGFMGFSRGDVRVEDCLELAVVSADCSSQAELIGKVVYVAEVSSQGALLDLEALAMKPISDLGLGGGTAVGTVIRLHLRAGSAEKCSVVSGGGHSNLVKWFRGDLLNLDSSWSTEPLMPRSRSPGAATLTGPMRGVQSLAAQLGFQDLTVPAALEQAATPRREDRGGPPVRQAEAAILDGGSLREAGKTGRSLEEIEDLKNRLDLLRRQAGLGQEVKRSEVAFLMAQRSLNEQKMRDLQKEKGKEKPRARSRSRGRRRRRSKGRGRRRRRSESDSRSVTSSDSELELRDQNKVRLLAQEKPGELLLTTIASLRSFLDRAEALPSAGSRERVLQPIFLRYHLQAHETSGSLGQRNLRELRTLAEALDHLIRGDVLRTADVLAQRFKAVELAGQEGSWLVAQHLELIPPSRMSATEDKEKTLAAREELRALKLREKLKGK